ncbi:hypothetical protein HNQ60_004600 [Povalibacter uvarum]|uniref:Uncharacterized protein n=1 Tax=Povalibacter uvarum TaxID=732238 RepID=A0A841HTU2_9GAMM|nr:hypothetical protein [Povalibacter uvarum]MBB6095709.1 hypothetical protein [Povalibacter uvarum]
MLKLLQTFLDIALWRKGPQDLPASQFLVALALAMYVAASFIQVQLLGLQLRTVIVVVVVDAIMMILWPWAVLSFFRRSERFMQTLTAMLGVGVLLALADIGVRVLQIMMAGPEQKPYIAWLFIRFVALALIQGRIFMHALGQGLLTGMALTVAIAYSGLAVAQLIVTRLQG